MRAPAPPQRSDARERLAAAIAGLADAEAQHARVAAAHGRICNDIFEKHQVATRSAMDDLAEAKERAPLALIASAFDEQPEPGLSVPEAESALAEATRQLANARAARAQLEAEIEKRSVSVRYSKLALDDAAKEVVRVDPALLALKAEFVRTATHALRCAKALATAGHWVSGIDGHGLSIRITTAAAPIGETRFKDDPAWLAALAALREDADAPLPSLPDDEPHDGRVAAAA